MIFWLDPLYYLASDPVVVSINLFSVLIFQIKILKRPEKQTSDESLRNKEVAKAHKSLAEREADYASARSRPFAPSQLLLLLISEREFWVQIT